MTSRKATRKTHPLAKKPPRKRRRRASSLGDISGGAWVTLIAVAVIGIGLFLTGRSANSGGAAKKGAAPPFTMTSTDGKQVSLSDYKGVEVLLYFSEGVGCDPCFNQMVDLEKNSSLLADRGITVLPIVMNPVSDTQNEMARFGIKTPFLIDSDGSVSSAYGVLGQGMHADLPGHHFVFVDGAGQIRWQAEYPTMYEPTAALLKALPATTGGS